MIRRLTAHAALLLTCSSLIAVLPRSAHSRPIQIIHTNDLHSHLEHSSDHSRGGFAAVKAKIDEIKARAAAQGIESIVLDAGDFSEGNPFYLAAKGESIYRVMDAMGYDAVTIGNHDWLMGTRDLDRLVTTLRPRFAFLGANFLMPAPAGQDKPSIRPFHEIRRAGLKIAILGLTTD